MSTKLRKFQVTGRDLIYDAWGRGCKNVLAVYPTGSGKTVMFSDIIASHQGASCVIAHRRELVEQMSLALARNGVMHRVIGPKELIPVIVSIHLAEVGQSFYDPQAPCAVAGVRTLIRRGNELREWLKSVTLWVTDEAHHLLRKNEWGKAVAMFPNAKGLGVTATALRADGCGLGRKSDGCFDEIVMGPTGIELIQAGYLTTYCVFSHDANIRLNKQDISAVTGDYKTKALHMAVNKSTVVGDIVQHYKSYTMGKLGVTFAASIKNAGDITDQFNGEGVPAELVTAKTPGKERIATLRRFRNRELLQLVNVDLFGEGFDLPAIETVSMGRPTASYGLYTQQFGRGGRLMLLPEQIAQWGRYTDEQRRGIIAQSIKPYATIHDHAGNVPRHGLPYGNHDWSLDARERRGTWTACEGIPVRSCAMCSHDYERVYKACPMCGHVPKSMPRSEPKHVDGDLTQLDTSALGFMDEKIKQVDLNPDIYSAQLSAKHVPTIGRLGHVKRHIKRQGAQKHLRDTIAQWAGWQRAKGRTDSQSYKYFYRKFGCDVMTAQTLNAEKATDLMHQIIGDF